MPFYIFIVFLLIILSALLAVFLQRNHFLITLLYFELIILSLTILVIISWSPSIIFFLIIILTLGACEARLGLALLVAITRNYGSDLLNVISINKC